MNSKSLFTIVLLIAGLSIFFSLDHARASAPVSIVDSLGAATPATKFPIIEATGLGIFDDSHVGPQFTLTQTTTLTEIGAFVNTSCITNDDGVALCSEASPLTVQIRPSLNGVPDPTTVIASFVLSDDNDPLVVSFESVAINSLLQPGTYFALFVTEPDNAGFLLTQATSPFNYQAEVINLGFLNPFTQDAGVLQTPAAVRILGETTPVLEDCDIVLPGGSTISELITECAAGANNHGQFVSCVSHATDKLKKAGTITGKQKSAIQRCVAQADIP